MLVVASDLHLTDGTSGETISDGAFEIFVDELSLLATSASARVDGSFVPVEAVDVLLLGDIFDIIRSSRWLQQGVRPWDDVDAMAPVVDDIVEGIIAANTKAFERLRSLDRRISVVPAVGDVVDVPLRLHMMVGNHDWMLRLPGRAFDAIRAKVIAAVPLSLDSHRADRPFAHDVDTDDAGGLDDILGRHSLVARHGDIYDAFNYERDAGRNASSLGDCMVIELLNRFPHDVQQALGLSPTDPLLLGLKEIDNVRPLLLIPTWLLGLLRRAEAAGRVGVQEAVMRVWRDRVEAFLEHSFVRSLDRPFRFDTVDGLEIALRASTHTSVLEIVSRLPEWAQNLIMGSDSYADRALDEPGLKSGGRSFSVYGHTHHAEVVPLRAEGDPLDIGRAQLSLNAGTWRCVHERCIGDGEGMSFAASHVMTWLTFFKDGERRGRRYEGWSGQLDRTHNG